MTHLTYEQKREAIIAHAKANPGTELVPVNTETVAIEAFGLPSAEALQKMRSRNAQLGLPVPPGLTQVPGLGWRYPSLMEARLWALEYYHQRATDVASEESEVAV
ncbi:MAG: hypothetical protein AAFO80_08305 [Pseudomonadota bacterium]